MILCMTKEYTINEFRLNSRSILNDISNGSEIIVTRFGERFRLSRDLTNSIKDVNISQSIMSEPHYVLDEGV